MALENKFIAVFPHNKSDSMSCTSPDNGILTASSMRNEDLTQNFTCPNRSCRSLICVSRLGSGRSHHLPYTGNPFTAVSGVYTTSMFVTAMITLASPLGANMPLTKRDASRFYFFDGVQTIT